MSITTAVVFMAIMLGVFGTFVVLLLVGSKSEPKDTPVDVLERLRDTLDPADTSQHGLIEDLANKLTVLELTEQLVHLEASRTEWDRTVQAVHGNGEPAPDPTRDAIIRQIERLPSPLRATESV